MAEKIGNSVRELTLSFDGQTNYTTEFTGIKEVLNKFPNIHTLTLFVYSGANC